MSKMFNLKPNQTSRHNIQFRINARDRETSPLREKLVQIKNVQHYMVTSPESSKSLSQNR